MTLWQAIYISALAVALWCGNPSMRVFFVMACNLIASAAFSNDPMMVALADLVCAAMLINAGLRAHIVAGLFATMVAVEVIGSVAAWQNSTTYAITDLIAYLQLGIIGHVDGGLSRINRAIRNRGVRRVDFYNSVASGRHSGVSVALVSGEGE